MMMMLVGMGIGIRGIGGRVTQDLGNMSCRTDTGKLSKWKLRHVYVRTY